MMLASSAFANRHYVICTGVEMPFHLSLPANNRYPTGTKLTVRVEAPLSGRRGAPVCRLDHHLSVTKNQTSNETLSHRVTLRSALGRVSCLAEGAPIPIAQTESGPAMLLPPSPFACSEVVLRLPTFEALDYRDKDAELIHSCGSGSSATVRVPMSCALVESEGGS
jgi:hypothetical protein